MALEPLPQAEEKAKSGKLRGDDGLVQPGLCKRLHWKGWGYSLT